MCNKQIISKIACGGGRNLSLDIVRCAAIVCVVAGHFFSINTKFRTVPFEGEPSLFLQGMANMFFGIGVPLFMLLTGYLNARHDEYSWHYIVRMKKVLFSYVFFSVLTILFRRYYLCESLSIIDWIKKILDFSAIPYGWYIEMWIGLYLLTPLLNKAYSGVRSQTEWVLGVLFFLSSVPYFTNRYGLYLMPAFWKNLYPILYFFIGRTLRDKVPGIKNGWLFLVIFAVCLINPLVSLIFARGHTMLSPAGGPWGIFGVPLSVSVFVLLLRTEKVLGEAHELVKAIITGFSILSLDIYLCCYISDRILYPWFMEHYFENQIQFGAWFFIIIPCLLLLSLLIVGVKRFLLLPFRIQ